MATRFIIDSNVIIDYTSSRLPEKGSEFVEQIFDNDFIVSVIVRIEVLGFADVPEKMSALEIFLDSASVLALDEAVTYKTISLRRQHKKLKLGDAIVAATALTYNLTIVTRNTSDFKNIEGVKFINPFDI
jgi:predicted nucleic acid-binding protein